MTLRDIAILLDEARATFVRDMEIVFSASPLDWPLYMLAVATVGIVVGFMLFVFAMAFVGEAWEKFHPDKKEPAPEPGPVSNFVFLAAVFSIAWLLAFAIMAALIQAVFGGIAGLWIGLAVATSAASFLIYLIRLGRRVGAQQNAE